MAVLNAYAAEMDPETLHFWRTANIILGIVALTMLTWRINILWRAFAPTWRLMAIAVFLMSLTQLWTTIENDVHANDWGWRVPLTTVSLIWLIVACAVGAYEDHRHIPGGGPTPDRRSSR